MTCGSASNETGSVGSLKKSGRATSMGDPPARSVIRRVRLTAWTMCSGPTATHGSGGSRFVTWSLSPSKLGRAAAAPALAVARVGAGGASATTLGLGVPVAAGLWVRNGRLFVGRTVGACFDSVRTLTDPREVLRRFVSLRSDLILASFAEVA